jgi:hypothetical protein
MDVQALAPYLAGPGAGLLICVLVGYGAYRIISSKIMPLVENFVNRHLAQIDAMQAKWDAADERRSQEHRDILDTCRSICDRLDREAIRDREITNPGIRIAP